MRHSNFIRTAPMPNKRSAMHGGRPTMKSSLSVSGSPEMEPESGGRNRIMIYGVAAARLQSACIWNGTHLSVFRRTGARIPCRRNFCLS
jgi:hypothetical protein